MLNRNLNLTVQVPERAEQSEPSERPQKRARDTDNPESNAAFWRRFPFITEPEVAPWQHLAWRYFPPTSPSYTPTSPSYQPTALGVSTYTGHTHSPATDPEQHAKDTVEQLASAELALADCDKYIAAIDKELARLEGLDTHIHTHTQTPS